MKFFDSQGFFPQLEIVEEGGKPVPDAFDEVGVDGDIHVIGKQGTVEGGVKAFGPGDKEVLLDGGGQGRGHGVLVVLVGRVVGGEGVFPDPAVRVHEKGDEVAVGEFVVKPLVIFDGAEAKVGVVQLAEDAGGRPHGFGGHGQKLFHLLTSGVGLVAQDFFHEKPVVGKGAVGKEALHDLFVNGLYLGGEETRCLGNAGVQVHGLLKEPVIGGVGLVLIVSEVGVGVETLQGPVHRQVVINGLPKYRGRLAKTSLKGAVSGNFSLGLPEESVPRGIICEHGGEIPFVGIGYVASLGYGRHLFYLLCDDGLLEKAPPAALPGAKLLESLINRS